MVVNLDPFEVHESTIHVPVTDLGLPTDEPYEVEDLLSGERFTWRGAANYVRLDPEERVGHILRVMRPRRSTEAK
jgi:starch synthase (maltosyl-transferring)